MDILILSTWFPCPPDNGSRLRAFHLIRHLAARHRVRLITGSRDGVDVPVLGTSVQRNCVRSWAATKPGWCRGAGTKGIIKVEEQ